MQINENTDFKTARRSAKTIFQFSQGLENYYNNVTMNS